MSGAPFAGVGAEALRALANALESGLLTPPYGSLSAQRHVSPGVAEAVARELSACAARGAAPAQIAYTLRLVATERERALRAADGVELVWTGPEVSGAVTRDTAIVVRELFASARQSVLVSGYAVYQGKRVFQELAANLDATPELRVRMFLNIQRGYGDRRSDDELRREFAETFRAEHWPGTRLPEVYYDPRALSQEPGPRGCLHAKCIVVDRVRALITSANFTEAAQERNIEAGILLDSPAIARALSNQFDSLVQQGALINLAGLG